MKPDTARRLWCRSGDRDGPHPPGRAERGPRLVARLWPVVGTVGILLSLWFGIGTASQTTVARLEAPLETVADHLATVRVVLERSDGTLARIERLLQETR
jgi:hypothetical protein